MTYSNDPHLPRVRMEAVRLVRSGLSTVKVARHMGYSQSAIVKWVAKAPTDGRMIIPTQSSRFWTHPHSLSAELVETILSYRRERNQCAEILHYRLATDGYRVSLSSVKRTLQRNQMTRFSK
ncbi:MAG: hypothetical protein HZB99_00350 [Candidatus Harrisonbacteria bacterium]|nr:hypothetical protein [Candidatus Harrisonbacteria bacterium]